MDANKLLACLLVSIHNQTHGQNILSCKSNERSGNIYTHYNHIHRKCNELPKYTLIPGYPVNDTLLADQIASRPIRPHYRLRGWVSRCSRYIDVGKLTARGLPTVRIAGHSRICVTTGKR